MLKKTIVNYGIEKSTDYGWLYEYTKYNSKQRPNQVCMVVHIVCHTSSFIVGIDKVQSTQNKPWNTNDAIKAYRIGWQKEDATKYHC